METKPASALADTLASTSDSPAELAAGAMIGQYRVEGRLGRGGMGEVFAAIHPLIGKRVAIKVIRADRIDRHGAVERFIQEARAVNEIGHPNIVDIFAFGSLADGRPYLAMERLDGETLRDRLERGSMPAPELAHVCEGICRALHAAHSKGIVHRDLKPENVFLVAVAGDRPHVKLLDFGLAKLTERLDLRAAQTEVGMMLGTPRYLAPEQASGHAVDHRADLYALGTMVFEMVAGRTPFLGDTAMELVSQHLTEPAPRLGSLEPSTPTQVDDLVAGLLEKVPDDRPTLVEVRQTMTWLAGEGAAPAPATHRRRWWIAGFAAVALGATALAAALGASHGAQATLEGTREPAGTEPDHQGDAPSPTDGPAAPVQPAIVVSNQEVAPPVRRPRPARAAKPVSPANKATGPERAERDDQPVRPSTPPPDEDDELIDWHEEPTTGGSAP